MRETERVRETERERERERQRERDKHSDEKIVTIKLTFLDINMIS